MILILDYTGLLLNLGTHVQEPLSRVFSIHSCAVLNARKSDSGLVLCFGFVEQHIMSLCTCVKTTYPCTGMQRIFCMVEKIFFTFSGLLSVPCSEMIIDFLISVITGVTVTVKVHPRTVPSKSHPNWMCSLLDLDDSAQIRLWIYFKGNG